MILIKIGIYEIEEVSDTSSIILQMRSLFALFMIVMISVPVMGQVVQPAGKLQVNTAPGGIVEATNMPVAKDKGTHYLEDQWFEGVIYLRNNLNLEKHPIRYDIENDLLEFKYQNEVRVIEGITVSHFEYTDVFNRRRYFERSDKYVPNEDLPGGFVEVIVEGDPGLLVSTRLEVLKPSYVTALDVGERSNKIVKKVVYFLRANESLIRLPMNKKKFVALLKTHDFDVNDHIKANHLSVKDRDDLVEIVDFLKTLR